MGNDNDSSYNNRRSAKSVYKLCGDITSYFLLLIMAFEGEERDVFVMRRKRKNFVI